MHWTALMLDDDIAAHDRVPSIKRMHTLLSGPLKNAGFSKTGGLWSKRCAECITMVQPQRSSWSDLYYINLAADYFSPRDRKRPAEHEADVRERLNQLVPEEMRTMLQAALDFETQLTDQQRGPVIHEAIEKWGLPFLDRYSTIDGVRAAQRNDPGFGRVAIRLELKKLL